jgi:hypothetical protein
VPKELAFELALELAFRGNAANRIPHKSWAIHQPKDFFALQHLRT